LYQYFGNGQFVDGSVMLEFNDYYSYTSSELQQMTCHEMGHAIGLDHNFYKTSCLYYAVDPGASRYPANVDYSLLVTIY
jgi:predicted Zn-dependent protease